MPDFLLAVLGGVLFTIGVIAGIGPQNLNTMTHAIRKNHELAVATTSFLADAGLILLSILGLELLNSKKIIIIINLAGIVFLVYYLWLKIKSLNKVHELRLGYKLLTKKASILQALALTLLNPLVFIDTVIVIGGASTHYYGVDKFAFAIGALLGDFIWIYGLTIIARTFAAQLNRPRVWFIIDILTILLVGYILFKMINFFLV